MFPRRSLYWDLLILLFSIGASAQELTLDQILKQNEGRHRDFARFDPNYDEARERCKPRMMQIGKELANREAAGKNTLCSRQIAVEAAWLLQSTADFKRIGRRLDDLESSLANPEGEARAGQQDPTDGSWGRCSTEWFLKLNASYSHIAKMQWNETKPQIELLHRINSPEKLTQYINSIATSDIARTGIDHRREFNEALKDLSRLILRGLPRGYPYHPELKQTMRDLILKQLRDSKTGWWGEKYIREGRVEFVGDLSVTFHMITFLKGDVPEKRKVIKHLLDVKDLQYPEGWLEAGQYSNHNNMDVVDLFRYGWSDATPVQKRAMVSEIDKMLNWCLNESLQADGTFRPEATSDSLEEQEYFGVAFLARAGYFDESRRFWTARKFPDAADVRQKIIDYIEKHRSTGGAGGSYYADALEELNLMNERTKGNE